MTTQGSSALRSQYERYPYPPISFLALPRRNQGQGLAYERAAGFLGRSLDSSGIRVLVIGGGTLEPLVVSLAHPGAREIVNVDLSLKSVQILNRRLRFFDWVRPLTRRAKVNSLVGDFQALDLGLFDYVIASNVLHHTEDPQQALIKASELLQMGGILRLVTYPKGSRYWMRETSKWLISQKVHDSPNPKLDALKAVGKLSITNPIRTTFESHPERGTNAGVIDAFFNARENPLSPLEWQVASENANFTLVGETQTVSSQSSLVDNVATGLSRWEKLQIMDDTWELCANPILWFEKGQKGGPHLFDQKRPEIGLWPAGRFERADAILRKGKSSLAEWQAWLKKEVGPRVWPGHPDEILRGLSITEYRLHDLKSLRP